MKQTPFKIIAIIEDDNSSIEFNGKNVPLPGLNNLIDHGLNFAQQFMNRENSNNSTEGKCRRMYSNFGKCPFQKKPNC